MLLQRRRADSKNACRCNTDYNEWPCRNQHNNFVRYRLHGSQVVQALQTSSYCDCCCNWPLTVLYATGTTTGDDSILPAHQPVNQSCSFIHSCLFIHSLYTCFPILYKQPKGARREMQQQMPRSKQKRHWHAAVASNGLTLLLHGYCKECHINKTGLK